MIWKALLLALALVAAAAVLTLWRANRNEVAAELAYPPVGRFVDVDGTRVHYVTEGTGPDLVLIHGAGGNLRDFTFDMVGRLSDRYRVTAFDRPGLGYSEPVGAAGTIAEQARVLAGAADRIGVSNPIVVGQSYGAAVALAWALERPGATSGLVLISGVSNPWDTGVEPLYRVLATPLGETLVAPALTAWANAAYVGDRIAGVFAPQTVPEGYAEYVGAGLTLRRATLLRNARQIVNLLAEVEAQVPRYGEISIPVEIVHGDADTIVGLEVHSRPLAAQIPGAALTVLEGVGHMPHQVAPEPVDAAIDRAAARAGLR